jgi:transposase InsO family protein
VKYRFVERHKKAWPVGLMCKVLQISNSAYYAWRKRPESVRKQENMALIPLVREIHIQMRKSYGTRRMAKELRKRGFDCGRNRARTLMRLADVRVKQKKKFCITTDSNHNLPIAANLLDRKFNVSEPNRYWVSDISYIWTAKGWLYLATVMDLYSRRIVGWSMDTSMTRKLVMDALLMAVWRRKPGKGLILHSDRGSQYCSIEYQNILRQHGIVCSMSRKGNCWDNAVMERFFHSLKSEQVYFMNYQTPEEAKKDIVDYIEMFYNSNRSHSYLGYLSPNEYERVHHQLPMAA